jgi:hypothetical protein
VKKNVPRFFTDPSVVRTDFRVSANGYSLKHCRVPSCNAVASAGNRVGKQGSPALFVIPVYANSDAAYQIITTNFSICLVSVIHPCWILNDLYHIFSPLQSSIFSKPFFE